MFNQDRKDLTEFVGFYEANKKGIFNYILYRVGFDRFTAEDLTSEIFIKAFEHFDTYDRKRPFKTWIFTIAHNHLINYRMGRKEVLSLDDAIEVVKEDPEGSYAKHIDQESTMEKILKLVSKLPEAQRDIVIMRYVRLQ